MFALAIHAQSDWVDKSHHKSGFITVNGVRLHYLDWGGKGDTMLFLHGFGDTAHIYDVLAPKLTNQFRVLALTRRGHGESEKPESGYDTANRVEDIRQFLDAVKIRRVVLVGHSAAGHELTLFGGVHPDRVIKLVYLDAVYITPARLELVGRMPPEFVEALGSSQHGSGAWEATSRVNASTDREKRSRALGLMLEQGAEARQDYTKIKSPALYTTVVGFPSNMVNSFKALPEPRRKAVDEFLREYDAMKKSETEHFRKEIPSARVVVLTNAHHECFIDREDEVLGEMRKFLSQ